MYSIEPLKSDRDSIKKTPAQKQFTEDSPDKLTELYETQKRALKKIGFKRCPHILFILDDIVQSKDFMNSKILTDIFFGGTHSKVSLWLLSQNYMSIPRRLRMNCHNLILCHGVNSTEIERFSNEWQSAYLKRKEFTELVEYCLDKQYSFLFLNATNPNKKKMYRCGFENILAIP